MITADGSDEVWTKMTLQTDLEKRISDAAQLDDTSREYELALTSTVNSREFDLGIMESLLEANLGGQEGSDDSSMVRAYAVFYCLNIYHRLNHNKEILDRLWTAYRKRFVDFKSLGHLEILRVLTLGDDHMDAAEQERLMRIAANSADQNRDNAGYLHAFADLFATFMKRRPDDSREGDSLESLKARWGDKALAAADDAISLDPDYAKYYCTRGRILSVMGAYDSAERSIQMAFDKESSERADYAVRIGNYQYARLQNQTRMQAQQIKELLDEQQQKVDKLNDSLTSNIETIAIFSGIVSFVLGSLSLADGETAVHAGLLVITLMGALIAALGSFSLLLRASNPRFDRRLSIVVTAIGMLIAVVAVVLTQVM